MENVVVACSCSDCAQWLFHRTRSLDPGMQSSYGKSLNQDEAAVTLMTPNVEAATPSYASSCGSNDMISHTLAASTKREFSPSSSDAESHDSGRAPRRAVKKPRARWTPELHQKFVEAIEKKESDWPVRKHGGGASSSKGDSGGDATDGGDRAYTTTYLEPSSDTSNNDGDRRPWILQLIDDGCRLKT